MKILLVEDSPVNIRLALILLKKLNHNVVVAKNGEKGVQLFIENHERSPVQCVLMDIHMPIMDGREAARKIRQFENGTQNKTPIVAMTATIDPADEKKNNCTGGEWDYILKKPISLESLNDLLVKIST